MVDLQLPIVSEPPLSDLVRILQREVGYLKPDMSAQYLEIVRASSCIGMYVPDGRREFLAAAHLDGGNSGFEDQAGRFLSYFDVTTPPEESLVYLIVSSDEPLYSPVNLRRVTTLVSMYGYQNIVTIRLPGIVTVIADKKNNLYYVDPHSVKEPFESDVDFQMWSAEMLMRRLHCVNNGEILNYSHQKAFNI